MCMHIQQIHDFTLQSFYLIVTDKNSMADIFNRHFIKSGFVFESSNPSCISKTPSPLNPTPQPSIITSPGRASDLSQAPHSFSLRPFLVGEVLPELTSLDPKKPAGSDELAAFFIKIAAPIIATPLTYIFNLSLSDGRDTNRLERSNCTSSV